MEQRTMAVTPYPSEHSREWAVYVQVRPDPTQGPTGLTLRSDYANQYYLDEFGVRRAPPAAVTYPPADTNLVVPHVQGDYANAWPAGQNTVINQTVGRYAHTITVNNRVMAPVYWSVSVDAGPAIQLLSPGIETGTGSGYQISEAYIERLGAADALLHNPTMMGAGQPVEGFDGFVYDVHHQMRLYSGIPIYSDTTAGRIRYANYPADFLGYGTGDYGSDEGQATQDHGTQAVGDEHFDQVPIFYAYRFFQDTRLNWRGSAVIHRTDYWSYCPTRWDANTAPFAAFRTFNRSFVPALFTSAKIIDLALGAASGTLISGFPPPAPGTYWVPDISFSRKIKIERVWSPPADPITTITAISPNYSDKMAIMLKSASPDLCVAIAAKVSLTDSDDIIHTASRLGPITTLQLSSLLVPGHTPLAADESSSAFLAIRSITDVQREAGWVGTPSYFLIGTEADVIAGLDALYASGDMDLEADAPPAAVIDGTVFDREAAGLDPSTLQFIRDRVRQRWERAGA